MPTTEQLNNVSKEDMTEISTLEILIRLIVAAVLAGVIGYEREIHHKPAGMRTYILVSIGTAVMTIASIEVARFSSTPEAVDVSRIASTILPGIGFIGAGTIIQSRGTVMGLTTAAGIWAVAAIGMVSGMGLYSLALIATILTFVMLVMLRGGRTEEEREEKANGSNRKL